MNVGLPLLSSPKMGNTHSLLIQEGTCVMLETVNDQTLETGGSVWHGSYALAKFLAQNQHLVKGKTVIELGAGCGLGGLVASILGAKRVILTDIPTQIGHLEKNVQLNHTSIDGHVVCIPLLFGETDADMRKKLQAKLGEEQYEEGEWVVDVVLGADVGYDLSLHEPLAVTISSLLQHSRGKKCSSSIDNSRSSSSTSCIPLFNPNPFPIGGIALLVEEIRWRDIYQWYVETLFAPPPSTPVSDYHDGDEEDGNESYSDGIVDGINHGSIGRGNRDDACESNLKLTLLNQTTLHSNNVDTIKDDPGLGRSDDRSSSKHDNNNNYSINSDGSDKGKGATTHKDKCTTLSLATSRSPINLLVCCLTGPAD